MYLADNQSNNQELQNDQLIYIKLDIFYSHDSQRCVVFFTSANADRCLVGAGQRINGFSSSHLRHWIRLYVI